MTILLQRKKCYHAVSKRKAGTAIWQIQICQIFEFFESGKYWGHLAENDASWMVHHGNQCCLKLH